MYFFLISFLWKLLFCFIAPTCFFASCFKRNYPLSAAGLLVTLVCKQCWSLSIIPPSDAFEL